MAIRKNLPCPMGYVRNQFGFLISWEWAVKSMIEADRTLFNRLNLGGFENHQEAFRLFSREFHDRHNFEFKLDTLDD